jgi:thiol-disulfide isomerase/thioredoxin
MKHLKFCLPILIFSFFLIAECAYGNKTEPFSQPTPVTIVGKILNFSEHQDKKTIQFMFIDILSEDFKNKTVELDETGHFRLEVMVACPQDFYLEYGRMISLFCSPGDQLYLEIDPDASNDLSFIRKVEGNASDIIRHIQLFLDMLPSKSYTGLQANENIKNMTFDVYTNYINQRDKVYLTYLKNFIQLNETDSLFRRWAYSYIKYGALEDLMRYSWNHPLLNEINKDTFQLPATYYAFLKTNKEETYDMLTMQRVNFLNELMHYSTTQPRDSLRKVLILTKNNQLIEGYQVIRHMIEANTIGVTRELFLTRFYLLLLKGMQLNLFESLYTDTYTTNPLFLDEIITTHDKLKAYLSDKLTPDNSIEILKMTPTAGLIDSITSTFKNKVIYMDFWEPTCGPCLEEMNASKEIQAIYKGRDVVFLFLCRWCPEDAWRATIAKRQLTGSHILLNSDQSNVLSSKLGISGVPHYTLIDKQGYIVMKDAIRPSQKEALIREINALLDK